MPTERRPIPQPERQTDSVTQAIQRHLTDAPAAALALLPHLPCHETRSKLAVQIAQSWPRTDINAAWNAIARTPLNATEKQLMFNELWG